MTTTLLLIATITAILTPLLHRDLRRADERRRARLIRVRIFLDVEPMSRALVKAVQAAADLARHMECVTASMPPDGLARLRAYAATLAVEREPPGGSGHREGSSAQRGDSANGGHL